MAINNEKVKTIAILLCQADKNDPNSIIVQGHNREYFYWEFYLHYAEMIYLNFYLIDKGQDFPPILKEFLENKQ